MGGEMGKRALGREEGLEIGTTVWLGEKTLSESVEDKRRMTCIMSS